MAKLGGALIGYGIKKRNGEEKKVIFDKPIHNTITKSCLNNLLTFDGTNATPTTNLTGNYVSLFAKSSLTSERYGVFNSAALGDGTGETSVNDTELKHRVTDATSTKKTGSGWCGTSIDYTNAVIKLRLSHKHNITSNFTVKEIGWYNQKWQELFYSLSARVQLDEGISVESGEEFYSIYELTIQFQDVERFSDFAGLGVGGYKVNAQDVFSDQYVSIPCINGNGIATLRLNESFPGQLRTEMNYINSYLAFNSLFKYLTVDWDKKKTIATIFPPGTPSYGDVNFKDYVTDSFFRDVEFTVPQNAFSSPVFGIVVNGTFYRFGTFDEQDNFTPTPITINGALKITSRQRWSTDLLTPAG